MSQSPGFVRINGMMNKIGMFVAVLGFTLTSILSAEEAKTEVVKSLEKIVELREEQLKLSSNHDNALVVARVSIRVSQAKIELAKEVGDKAKVRLEFERIVGHYEEITELDGELPDESRLENRIALEEARLESVRYHIANPTQEVFIGSGVSINVDF